MSDNNLHLTYHGHSDNDKGHDISTEQQQKGKPRAKPTPGHPDIVDTTDIEKTYDRPGNAYTEGKFARAEKYEDDAIAKTGVYAEAGVGRARAEYSIFEAEAKGPNASAGAEASKVGLGAIARAEVASASAKAGPFGVKVGLGLDTGASVGAGGVEAKFLGTGFTIDKEYYALATNTSVMDDRPEQPQKEIASVTPTSDPTDKEYDVLATNTSVTDDRPEQPQKEIPSVTPTSDPTGSVNTANILDMFDRPARAYTEGKFALAKKYAELLNINNLSDNDKEYDVLATNTSVTDDRPEQPQKEIASLTPTSDPTGSVNTANIPDTYDRPARAYTEGKFSHAKKYAELLNINNLSDNDKEYNVLATNTSVTDDRPEQPQKEIASVTPTSDPTGSVNTANILDMFDRPARAYTEGKFALATKNAEGLKDNAGKTIPKTGVYAAAGVGQACAEYSIFEAEAKGPNASAGASASKVGVEAMARAEVASASAKAGQFGVKVGLGFDTGASASVDGFEAKLLGTGFTIGKKTSVSVLGNEASCSVM
ncbi:hypothetical protein ROHU_032077 [Labeo rohita]|uniref:Uncharacterized protein n=1 Tax=Labeo rohita TaxID=84645 RepID=A0A498LQW7_LABRO|nr:hypothetical protein ROHU_032077 [Labeo rohita]